MKPFKHILYSLLLLFTVFASAQTPFPTGIRLPNATEVVTADSIPVIDANNIIKKWISVDNLIASGGTIDQDNTNKIVTLYLGTNPNTESTIAAAINALPLFVITDKETPYFFSFSTYIQGTESIAVRRIAILKDKGKGSYGTGSGNTLTVSDIRIIDYDEATPTDIANLGSTQTINLGDVGSSDIVTAFNAHTFTGLEDPVQDQADGYVLVNVTISGTPLQYLFVGVGGDYGVGGTETAVLSDFVLLSDTVAPDTVLSIQDKDGVEQFTTSNYLKFESVSFDPALKKISINSLVPLSAFLDITLGNDTTAAIENSKKPFKTMTALISALPVTTGETYTIYIKGGTVPITRKMPARNLKFVAYTSTTLDFTNCMENDGITNAQYVINGTANALWTFEAENISLISNYVGVKTFGYNSTLNGISIKGTINILNWKSTDSQPYYASFIFNGGSDFKIINLYDSPQDTYILTQTDNSLAALTIKNLYIQYARTLFRQFNNEVFIDNITQVGVGAITWRIANLVLTTITLKSVAINGTVQPYAKVLNFNNCTLGATTVIETLGTLKITGTLTGTNPLKNQYQDKNQVYENFKGKINQQYVYGSGTYKFINCSIEVQDWIFSRNNGHTTPNFVTFEGFNTIQQINTVDNLFRAHQHNNSTQINPIHLTINGTLKTNALSYGKDVTYSNNDGTFKEKLKEIVVRSKHDLLKPLDSNLTYIVDGTITLLTGEYITIPTGGLTLQGYGFNVSQINKNVAGQSIFNCQSGNCGDFITNFIQFNSGAGSVFNVTDTDNTNAIELNDVNFIGCSSLGKMTGFRQFTGTTVGIYGCSDGLEIEGAWNGFKITNTNVFGFGSSGTLFKKGTTTTFNNRVFLGLNIDFPTGAKLADFVSANFNDDNLFQINNTNAKVNGIISNANTTALIPNLIAVDDVCFWSNNIGLENTPTTIYSYTGATLDLSDPLGKAYNQTTPSSAVVINTNYSRTLGWAITRINTATKPDVFENDGVTPATEIAGATWVTGTTMDLVVKYNGVRVEYYYLAL